MPHVAARLLAFPLILLGVALMRISALALAAGLVYGRSGRRRRCRQVHD